MLNPNGEAIYSAALTEFAELVYDIVVVKAPKGKPVSKDWEKVYNILLLLHAAQYESYLEEENINAIYDCLVSTLNIYDTSAYPTPTQPDPIVIGAGPPGPPGPPGEAGANGTNGIDGTPIQFLGTFTTAPSNPSLNQAYRNSTTGQSLVWDGTVWQVMNIDGLPGQDGNDGINGTDGEDGLDGKTLLSGIIDPTTEGVDGDFYINTSTWQIFGPKNAGSWGVGQDILGDDGANGTNGTNGTDGTPGVNGSDGSSSYLYVGLADNSSGLNFVPYYDAGTGTTTYNPDKKFIAFKITSAAILGLSAADFSGLWFEFRGTGDRWSTSSSSSMTIGTGVKNLFVGTELAYSTGQIAVIAVNNDPSNRMQGPVISYDRVTGQLSVDIEDTVGSGTYASWDVSLQGIPGLQGEPGPAGYELFENTDVDIGTESADEFPVTEGQSVRWDYHLTDGTNSRSGSVLAVWDGTNVTYSDTSTPDIGDTQDVSLSADIDSGNIRLRITVISNNWVIRGRRYLTEGGGTTSSYKKINVTTKSGSYALALDDGLVIVTADSTQTLPAATLSTGLIYRIKKRYVGGSGITVDAVSGNIDGISSFTITVDNDTLNVVSDGTNYNIIE